MAATSNPWSRRRKVKLADLINEPWALPPPESPIGAAVAEVFRAAGFKFPAAAFVSEGAYVRLALVAEGRFLTFASEATLSFAGRDMPITALRTDLREIRNPVAIVTLKNRMLTPVAQLFIETVREVIKPLATGKSVSAQHRQPQKA